MPLSSRGSRNCAAPRLPPPCCASAGAGACARRRRVAGRCARCSHRRASDVHGANNGSRVTRLWPVLCATCSYEGQPEGNKAPPKPAFTDLWSVGAAPQPAAARQPSTHRCCPVRWCLFSALCFKTVRNEQRALRSVVLPNTLRPALLVTRYALRRGFKTLFSARGA